MKLVVWTFEKCGEVKSLEDVAVILVQGNRWTEENKG